MKLNKEEKFQKMYLISSKLYGVLLTAISTTERNRKLSKLNLRMSSIATHPKFNDSQKWSLYRNELYKYIHTQRKLQHSDQHPYQTYLNTMENKHTESRQKPTTPPTTTTTTTTQPVVQDSADDKSEIESIGEDKFDDDKNERISKKISHWNKHKTVFKRNKDNEPSIAPDVFEETVTEHRNSQPPPPPTLLPANNTTNLEEMPTMMNSESVVHNDDDNDDSELPSMDLIQNEFDTDQHNVSTSTSLPNDVTMNTLQSNNIHNYREQRDIHDESLNNTQDDLIGDDDDDLNGSVYVPNQSSILDEDSSFMINDKSIEKERAKLDQNNILAANKNRRHGILAAPKLTPVKTRAQVLRENLHKRRSDINTSQLSVAPPPKYAKNQSGSGVNYFKNWQCIH